MGMFDSINFECACPQCGARVKDFQSKDGVCICATLEFYEVDNFYCSCPKCDMWLEFNRFNRQNKEIKIEDYRLEVSKDFRNLKEAKEYFKNPKDFHKKEEKTKWDDSE